MDLCAYIYLSRSSYIRWMRTPVYLDTRIGKYVPEVCSDTCARTCIHVRVSRTRQCAASTCKKQVYNRQDYSGSARKEIITLRVRLTRRRTSDAYVWRYTTRNMCDVTYTVLEMHVRLRRAYLCTERVSLMQRNRFAVTTAVPFISWITTPLRQESLCSWGYVTVYANRWFCRVKYYDSNMAENGANFSPRNETFELQTFRLRFILRLK